MLTSWITRRSASRNRFRPNTAMAQPALSKFISSQFKGVGGAILGGSIVADIATSDNKLRAVLKSMKDIAVFSVTFSGIFAGAFNAMGKSVRSLLHDTGSLDAALKKLQKIQDWQKVFSPLVGGAKAAKVEVAKLVNLAASKDLKLDNVAAGARNLQVMTRGAYAGVDALSEVIDAADATGNSFEDMAEAVGGFNEALRGGGDIDQAAEKLRRMGAITQDAANQMVELQKNGGTAFQLMDRMRGSIGEFRGSRDRSKGEAGRVSAGYDAAKTNLQEKFGSPWADDEVERTKNYTEALKAIAPTVERLSQFFHTLFAGFETAKSGMVAWFAKLEEGSGIIEGTIKVVTYLITAISAFGAVCLIAASTQIAALITGLLGAATASGALAVALGVLRVAVIGVTVASGIGILVTILGTLYGVLTRSTKAVEEHSRALHDLNSAYSESNAAMQKQISLITTLEQKHVALEKAVGDTTEAYKEYLKTMSDSSKSPEEKAAAGQQYREKLKIMRSAAAAPVMGDPGIAKEHLERSERERRSTYQTAIADAGESQKMQMMLEEQARLRKESAQGYREIDAQAGMKGKLGDLDTREQVKEAEIAIAKQMGWKGKEGQLTQERDDIRRERIDLRMDSNSEYEQAQGELQDIALKRSATSDPKVIRTLEANQLASTAKRERAKMRMENAGQNADAANALTPEIRAAKISRVSADEEDYARRESQHARLNGNRKALQGIEDFAAAKEEFDRVFSRTKSVDQAEYEAGKFARNSIELSARKEAGAFGSGVATTDLARVFGGGNTGAVQGNPMLDTAKRTSDTITKIHELVSRIEEAMGAGDDKMQ